MANLILHGKEPEYVERMRQDWRIRLVLFLQGNRTPYGVLLLAILGKAASNPPRIVSNGVIDEDGIVWCAFQDRGQTEANIIPLGSVATINESFRRIADKAKLNDLDRIELHSEFRKWINEDRRTGPSLLK